VIVRIDFGVAACQFCSSRNTLLKTVDGLRHYLMCLTCGVLEP
jgi:hypothetical protein